MKSADGIAPLNRAAAVADGAYQLIDEKLKAGGRDNDIVGMVDAFVYRHGSAAPFCGVAPNCALQMDAMREDG